MRHARATVGGLAALALVGGCRGRPSGLAITLGPDDGVTDARLQVWRTVDHGLAISARR